MILFFVRHGDPCYNPDSLTPLGLRQAEAVGRRLCARGLDRIFSSPMKRAIQTAQPAAEMLGKEIEILDFASETHAWNELTLVREDGRRVWACSDSETQKLFYKSDVRDLGMRWYTHPAFENTTFQMGMERIQRESDRWLSSLGYARTEREGIYTEERKNDERIALFAHAGFGSAFFSHILGIPYPVYSQMFDLSHSCITAIEFKGKDGVVIPSVITMSNDAHLYEARLILNGRIAF
ncbi:MAG: histidine phosphatase family protein [Clostridia bacterium]|nr:histidine phosphatase family protein [Clostridia bacterium]